MGMSTAAHTTTQYGPAHIDPSDWDFVGATYIGNDDEIAHEFMLDMEHVALAVFGRTDYETDEFFSAIVHHDNGGCASCGAHFLYGAVFTNDIEFIHVGHTCGDEIFSMPSKVALDRKRKTKAAQTTKLRLAKLAEAQAFIAEHDLAADLETDHFITQDIARKLNQYGSISEKQIALLHKLTTQEAEAAVWKAEEAERTLTVPDITTGNGLALAGTVLTVKWQDSMYGGSLKMLVMLEDGTKVWGTVPSSIDPENGDEVSFIANVESSNDDPKFGFFKRPRKAVVTQVSE